MIIIQLFIGIIFALGIGCILFDVFKVPSMKASRATHNLGRKGDKKVSNISQTEALTRLEQRVGSALLSEVTLKLKAVIEGNYSEAKLPQERERYIQYR